jgi:dTDP-4-dehydrorhamnose reductase
MSRPRLLVLGAGGQVGSELVRAGPVRGFAVTGLTRADLDITRAEDVRDAIVRAGCALVVNAAAYTAVDRAEREPEAAFAVNRDGAANVASACTVADVPLLHLSTDYVFDGTKATSYVESDPVHPLSVYGASKAAGERAVVERLARHIVLRTSWVYSAVGHNFVRTMLRLGAERDRLSVVADQVGCPTSAADLAATVLTLAEALLGDGRERWGTYHYAGAGETSWHGFAVAIFDLAAPYSGRRPEVVPIATSEYPTPARRPHRSVLDCTRICETFGIRQRPWRDGLAEVVRALHEARILGGVA